MMLPDKLPHQDPAQRTHSCCGCPEEDLHKIKPIHIPTRSREGLTSPHNYLRSQRQSMVSGGRVTSLRIWFLVGHPCFSEGTHTHEYLAA